MYYLDEVPRILNGYELSSYSTLSIHYADTTGDAHYEDTSDYLIVEAADSYYLLEIGPNSNIDSILATGQITSKDDLLVYEITEDAYTDLAALFDKP